jgi:hypothetical protein
VFEQYGKKWQKIVASGAELIEPLKKSSVIDYYESKKSDGTYVIVMRRCGGADCSFLRSNSFAIHWRHLEEQYFLQTALENSASPKDFEQSDKTTDMLYLLNISGSVESTLLLLCLIEQQSYPAGFHGLVKQIEEKCRKDNLSYELLKQLASAHKSCIPAGDILVFGTKYAFNLSFEQYNWASQILNSREASALKTK